MYKSILVPLDGSPFSESALPVALQLARVAHAQLHLLFVHQPVPAFVGGVEVGIALNLGEESSESVEQGYLEGQAGILTRSGLCRVEPVLAHGMAGPVICDEVERREVDLVVMATHGRGAVGNFFLGSVARHVVHHAGVPVLLVRPGVELKLEPEADRRILVGADLRPESSALVARVAAMARLIGAQVRLLHVVVPSLALPSLALPGSMPPDFIDAAGEQQRAQGELDRMTADLRAQGCPASAQVVSDATPAAGVVRELKAGSYTMVAVSPHRIGLGRRLFLGSTARQVIRASAVPVLVFDGSGPGVQ